MTLCILLDSLSDGIIKRAAVRSMNQRNIKTVKPTKSNFTIAKQFLQGVNKRLRHAFPKNKVLVVLMAEHPLARRIRNRTHKLRKAYVIPSVDELLDLVFHSANVSEKIHTSI